MKKTGNNLSALFRSLGPDESEIENITKVVAVKTEKEWPLFKSVPPSEQFETPPLSPQERKVWTKQAKIKVEVPRPTLSMSGLSSKLAESLSQISEQMAVEEKDVQTDHLEKKQRSTLFNRKKESNSDKTLNTGLSMLAKASMDSEIIENEEKILNNASLEKPQIKEIAKKSQVTEKSKSINTIQGKNTNKSDDRLANIFSRLEEKEQVAVKPIEKRSSILKRIGKR